MCDPILVNPVVKMRPHPLASYKEVPSPRELNREPDTSFARNRSMFTFYPQLQESSATLDKVSELG